jgi:hypothetical protein
MNEIAVKWVDGLQFIGTDKWGIDAVSSFMVRG